MEFMQKAWSTDDAIRELHVECVTLGTALREWQGHGCGLRAGIHSFQHQPLLLAQNGPCDPAPDSIQAE